MNQHPRTRRRAAQIIGLLLGLLSLLPAAWAQKAPSPRAPEARLLPERFLREYDPVTLIFPEERGPREGGPADEGGALLSISPAHPGEYRWLDARSLQFLPAEPWPALRSFSFRGPGLSFGRSTLMAPPTSLSPSPGSFNLPSFSSLTLSFPTPLPVEDLAEMISLEVRPLPGLGSQAPLLLSRRDFRIKELDRSDRRSPARYLLELAEPVGDGRSLTLRIKLSLDEGIPGSVASYAYSTRTDFRVLAFGSGSSAYPLSSSGSNYPADQALNAGTGQAPLFIQFSEALAADTELARLRAMVAFEPSVRNLRFEPQGSRLLLYFDRDPDTDYELRLAHEPLRSASGRELSPFAPSSLHFYSKALKPYVSWKAGQAILERHGPQSLPMEARGVDKVDLRINRIDPLDLDYWPFPAEVLELPEASPPPMPGEEPPAGRDLERQIRLLGSPEFSEVVGLPTKEKGSAAAFGLDLLPALKRIGREGKSGSYLVGYRRIGADTSRHWVRVQVTDLSLSLVEEPRGLAFVVTSLRTGKPVEGATISLDALEDRPEGGRAARSLLRGRSDREGRFLYAHGRPFDAAVDRIAVETSDDCLVVDVNQAPPYFHDNHWFGSGSRWLSWLTLQRRTEDLAPARLAYLFTERPIYRAEEPVHVQGYVRLREGGLIKADSASAKRSLLIRGPDDKDYRYPVQIQDGGWFHQLFDEKELPTGSYTATLLDALDAPLASVSFQKEAYRIPSFEINLSSPDRVPFDEPFTVLLTASYYAGGMVAGQQVEWSVNEGAWSISPAGYEDYAFSSYLSVGGEYREEGVSASEAEDLTDDSGSARLRIDPRTAESIQPRYYRVQASVRGADAQTVSKSRTVLALPPFAIGLKLPRFETGSMAVKPSIVVLDHEERPLAGKDLVLRLYERQWHSYLSESDITTGAAKYVSDVVDLLVEERALKSGKEPLSLDLPVGAAGVYILEVQGRDAVGRLQSVKRDLYVAGPSPVAWKRTTAAVFETSLDQKTYLPGDRARLLIRSPFQEAEAFVVVEKPAGNEYQWVPVKNGQGLLELPVGEELVPRFPVHILLMRGRLPGAGRVQGGEDRLKPMTVANTTWIPVEPASNRLSVSLSHPPKAAPGTEFSIEIEVKDRWGKPAEGYLALWLVDRAVLSLAKERFASPLSSFITPVEARVRISDTRNLSVGNLPFEELAGGDMAEAGLFGDLLDKDTVRKNFKTVPYYEPGIPVRGGKARVSFTLPDNLTEFAVRAVAISGYDRFGVAKSTLAMRLPVLVQEALPRFFRPGDLALAGGIARVVEGKGGPGKAELELSGGLVLGPGSKGAALDIALDEKLPTSLYFPLLAPPALAGLFGAEGGLGAGGAGAPFPKLSLTLGAGRLSDGAKDAFRLELPLRPDAPTRRAEELFTPQKPGDAFPFPVPREAARPGATVQGLYLLAQGELVQVLRAIRFQLEYPYGCTEQRISKLHAQLALDLALGAAGLPESLRMPKAYMAALLEYLPQAISDSGLYAFYPGSSGSVGLTAYVVEFLELAKKAGHAVPQALLERPLRALKESLRSDYARFSPGYSLLERSLALCALDAAGQFDAAYGQELLSLAQEADAYIQARIWLVLRGKRAVNASQLSRLRDRVLEQVAFQRRGSELVVAGLQRKRSFFGNPFLYSDYRSMAAIYQVYLEDRPKAAETRAILSYILAGAGSSGWGDTYTNSLVLQALAEGLAEGPRYPAVAEIWDGRGWRSLELKGKPLAYLSLPSDAPLKVRMKSFDQKQPPSLLLETSWVPAALGSELPARSAGFSLSRELLDYGKGQALLRRVPAKAGAPASFALGAVIEDHVRVVNAADRSFTAVRLPLAAGFEPLNPNLATSPAEARPAGRLTREPAWADYQDDAVTFYYESLPAGTYDFYYRARANFEGSYTLPPATAQVLYELSIEGSSEGLPVRIGPAEGAR